MKKCLTCPYKLGLIKCKRNPCLQCKQSGRKTHPFPVKVIKRRSMEEKNEMKHMDTIWEEVKHQIVSSEMMSEIAYETWIRPLHPIALQGNQLILGVSDEFPKRIIEVKYRSILEKTAQKVIGAATSITLKVVSPEPDAHLQHEHI